MHRNLVYGIVASFAGADGALRRCSCRGSGLSNPFGVVIFPRISAFKAKYEPSCAGLQYVLPHMLIEVVLMMYQRGYIGREQWMS